MKTKRTLLIAIAVVSTFIYSHAQTLNRKDKFILSASSTELVMTPNSTAQMVVSILRSKRYQNANIELSLPNLPKGISVVITENIDSSKLNHITFSADDNAVEGNYSFVMYGYHSTHRKGQMIALKVVGNRDSKNATVSKKQ